MVVMGSVVILVLVGGVVSGLVKAKREGRIVTVSYTHLDVYKRQGIGGDQYGH